MKSNKNTRPLNRVARDISEEKSIFAIIPIISNVIAIVILVAFYEVVLAENYFFDYQNYIYWIVNVLVSYNILAAAARSIWVPLASLLIGFLSMLSKSYPLLAALAVLSPAQCWQLAIIGIVGLIITFSLKS